MNDPIAEAAAAQAAAQNQPSSTEPVPNGAGGASSDEQMASTGSAPAASRSGVGEQGNVSETQPSSPPLSPTPVSGSAADGQPSPSAPSTALGSSPSAGTSLDIGTDGGEPVAEHPHTSILRRMTETLRRKFNMFDSELETLLKDAESHL